ncbi:glycoside hydrolase family 76 protein [Moniliophthora roreri]|nr:glycoside hydrolase family 76 protein [Moniliophthora roreri]
MAISMFNAVGQLNDSSSYGTAGRLYGDLAEFDLVTNQTIYKDRLLRLFSQARTIESLFPNDTKSHRQLNFILAYAIAATRAYKAYSDKSFLEFAETAWRNGRQYTLSEDDLRAGTITGKNLTLKKTCLSLSMAGGTFYITSPNHGYLNALATGSHFHHRATAYLAEATTNQTYIDLAIETETFYYYHLRNFQGAFLDGIDAATCTPGTEDAHPYNAGLMMEGLAVLANVTRNTTIEEHLMEVINKTVPNRSWQGVDGIIAADTSGELSGQYIIRGLAAIYNRSKSFDLRKYIRNYIGVQYNAVLGNARMQGSSIYGASWTGPPASTFSGEGQTNALVALVAAIPLRDEVSPTPTSGGPNPTATSINDKNPTNVKAIAGGVFGGVVLLALLVGLALVVLRRRKQRQTSASVEDGHKNVTDETGSDRVHPFTAPLSEKTSLDHQRKGQPMLPPTSPERT